MNDHKKAMLLRTQNRLQRVARFKAQQAMEVRNQGLSAQYSENAELGDGSVSNEWRVA